MENRQGIKPPKIILVTGGARSGKSAFAERYAEKAARLSLGLGREEPLPEKCLAYLATAQVYDEEMRFRVERHRARRSKAWETYEAPTEEAAVAALRQAGAKQAAILFDCVTIFLSNLLCACPAEELTQEELLYERTREAAGKLLQAAGAAANAGAVVFVTNEVGAGIVPENALARRYRDLAGLANQQLAEAAESVYWVVSGQPVDVKKLACRL